MQFEDLETNQRYSARRGILRRNADTQDHNVIATPGDITHVTIWNPSSRAFEEMATPIGNPPDLIERQLQNIGSGDEADYVSQEMGPQNMKASGASNVHGVSPNAEFASSKGADGLVTSLTRGSQSSSPCYHCGKFTTPNNSEVRMIVKPNTKEVVESRVHFRCKKFVTPLLRW